MNTAGIHLTEYHKKLLKKRSQIRKESKNKKN